MATKTQSKPNVTATSNLDAAEDGSPNPIVPDEPNGSTVDEMENRPARRATVGQRVRKLGSIAANILANRGREAKIQLKIAADLATAEPMFVGEDGKPGTLPIVTAGLQGETITSDLSFYDWADTVCRLNYSSVRQYLQAAAFAAAHPAAIESGKVDGIKHAALMQAAEKRNPDAVTAILADLAPGATIASVETAIAAHAPKPDKVKKQQDTSKVQTALELSARDLYWPLLSQTCSGMDAAQIVAVQDLVASVVTMATDPNVGKGSAVFALAIGQLSREWNEQQQAAADKRQAAADKRQARTR